MINAIQEGGKMEKTMGMSRKLRLWLVVAVACVPSIMGFIDACCGPDYRPLASPLVEFVLMFAFVVFVPFALVLFGCDFLSVHFCLQFGNGFSIGLTIASYLLFLASIIVFVASQRRRVQWFCFAIYLVMTVSACLLAVV